MNVQNVSIHFFRIVPKHLFLGYMCARMKTRVPFSTASKSLFIMLGNKLLIKFSSTPTKRCSLSKTTCLK